MWLPLVAAGSRRRAGRQEACQKTGRHAMLASLLEQRGASRTESVDMSRHLSFVLQRGTDVTQHLDRSLLFAQGDATPE